MTVAGLGDQLSADDVATAAIYAGLAMAAGWQIRRLVQRRDPSLNPLNWSALAWVRLAAMVGFLAAALLLTADAYWRVWPVVYVPFLAFQWWWHRREKTP